MSNITRELEALDAMVAQGKILESLPEYFAENCAFTEMADGATRPSRNAQHEHLSGFFSTLKGFNGATLHSSAVNGDTSLSEWTFDMIAGDGSSIIWHEVLVRRWQDGKVVAEKYYNATS